MLSVDFIAFDSLYRLPRDTLQSAPASYNRRLYQTDGMIPKYTGYIPRKSSSTTPL